SSSTATRRSRSATPRRTWSRRSASRSSTRSRTSSASTTPVCTSSAMPDPRRSVDRFRTVGEGTETLHSFSYAQHYDPNNVGFGPVMVINEERIAPGAGYDEHQHADVDIVTWVLEGALAHEDSTGQRGVVLPGVAQRLS